MKTKRKFLRLRTGSVVRKGDEWLTYDNRWRKVLAWQVGLKLGSNQVYRRPI